MRFGLLAELLVFLQGTAYPAYGGDEPLTPTSQAYCTLSAAAASLLCNACYNEALTLSLRLQSGPPGSFAVGENGTPSTPHLEALAGHQANFQVLQAANSNTVSLHSIPALTTMCACCALRWIASTSMPARVVTSSWLDCLAVNYLGARRALEHHHRPLVVWCLHHRETASLWMRC